ncbi:MAG TPA: type II toxin-antitoxin system RelE/ParE family toxin [Caulifigura sp.]|nr:type II toxin-antitoxin system RelE/ParE family toxin [Caulifigura sp.]
MTYRIILTGPADRDIRDCIRWWRINRSSEQAARWADRVFPALASLRQSPERCIPAPESDLFATGLRQLHFGVGRRTTHRILFTIVDDEVRVLRVRHIAQQELSLDDFS